MTRELQELMYNSPIFLQEHIEKVKIIRGNQARTSQFLVDFVTKHSSLESHNCCKRRCTGNDWYDDNIKKNYFTCLYFLKDVKSK
jgi:hypothetical protein